VSAENSTETRTMHSPREIHLLRYKIIEAPKKFKKYPRPHLSLILTIYVIKKPNPSRDAFPLNDFYLPSGGFAAL
jgi:hypothetical protein